MSSSLVFYWSGGDQSNISTRAQQTDHQPQITPIANSLMIKQHLGLVKIFTHQYLDTYIVYLM